MPALTPIRRPRNIVFLLVALFLAFIGHEVYLALTATPGRAIDYAAKLEELIEANQPADTNAQSPDAWPVIRDLIDRLATIETELTRDPANPHGIPVDFTALTGGYHSTERYDEDTTWPDMESLARRGLVSLRAAGIFDTLNELTTMRRAVRRIPKGPLIGVLLPELGKMRQLARINGARMTEASIAGDEREFIQAYEATLALGRLCAVQGFLIEHLVGIAIDSLANGRLREALTERPFSADACTQLLAAMDRQLPIAPVATAMRAEHLSTLDIIQWTHTDDGHGDGRIIFSAAQQLGGLSGSGPTVTFSKFRIFNLASIAFPGKKATTDKANDYFSRLIAYAELSPGERRKHPFSTSQWMDENLPTRYLILRMCLPAVDKAIQSRNCLDLETDGTRLMLALELYRAKNGRYPATLDELVPSILPAIPQDIIANAPFVYRLIKPEEDALRRSDGSPRPYLLYSRGRDGADNGGKSNPKNDHLALTSPTGVGFDFVFNSPRDHAPPTGAAPEDKP